MSLLDELPSEAQFTTILASVVGNADSGTGVAGVLKLIEQVNPDSKSTFLTSKLNGSVSASVTIDLSSLNGGALAQFRQATEAIPSDPAQLLSALTTRLDSLRGLSLNSLPGMLTEGASKLGDLDSIVPAELGPLLTGATAGLNQLQSELVDGAFGGLRQWSASIQSLLDELAPLIAGGPGTVEDRLITYLRDKIIELISALLPQQKGPADLIAAGLSATLSVERLTEINTLKAEVIAAFAQIRAQFESGDFTSPERVAAAQASLQRLTTALSSITSGFHTTLAEEFADATGLARTLHKEIAGFAEAEVTDLGSLRAKCVEAISKVEQAVNQVDLQAVRDRLGDVFGKLRETIGQADLGRFTTGLADLQGQVQSAADLLDGALFEAIASIRNILAQARAALNSVVSALGSFDNGGVFHFHVQQQIKDFYDTVKQTLNETIQPLLNEFKTTVTQVLGQVHDQLDAIKAQIETVKGQLQSALQGVNTKLVELNVPAKLEEIRTKLDTMLESLGTIDFAIVTDPVVEQIGELRDQLKQIDVSKLSEISIGALKVSVEVVTTIDFSAKITDALMAEIDQILQVPKNALTEIETTVEGALDRLGKLAPETLLKPLDDLFQPVTAMLNRLEFEQLIGPIDAWHERTLQELDKVSPSAVLQPVIALFQQLEGMIDALAPAKLVQPLQGMVDGLKADLGKLDLAGLLGGVTGALNRVRDMLGRLAPERLLDPLVALFDRVMTALDRFSPSALLTPFTTVFDQLTAPLGNLNLAHVAAIGAAFAPLRSLPNAYDPRYNVQTLRRIYAEQVALLQQLNIGKIIADLKAPYDSLKVMFDVGGVDVTLAASIEGLNPLRNAIIGQVATGVQQIQAKLQNAFLQADPPAELVSAYEQVRPKITALVPSWITDGMTVETVRAAFRLANPLNLSAEMDQLYEAVKNKLRLLDPRALQQELRETVEQVLAVLEPIDPATLLAGFQGAVDAIIERLDVLKLETVVDELQTMFDEIRAVVGGLNPEPIIAELGALAAEVRQLLEGLKPSEVLSGVSAPFQDAKDIVNEFDPAVFKAALQQVFENIQQVIGQIDIGVILSPLVEQLDALREALRVALQRTEDAFNEMLAAIPV